MNEITAKPSKKYWMLVPVMPLLIPVFALSAFVLSIGTILRNTFTARVMKQTGRILFWATAIIVSLPFFVFIIIPFEMTTRYLVWATDKSPRFSSRNESLKNLSHWVKNIIK